MASPLKTRPFLLGPFHRSLQLPSSSHGPFLLFFPLQALAINVVLFVSMIIFCPITVMFVHVLTRDLQNNALTLVDKVRFLFFSPFFYLCVMIVIRTILILLGFGKTLTVNSVWNIDKERRCTKEKVSYTCILYTNNKNQRKK